MKTFFIPSFQQLRVTSHLILPLTLPDRTSHHFILRAHSFRVADAGCDIVQHDIRKMEGADEYAGFTSSAKA